MSIYDFFNSPDVAEYCRSIGHTMNTLESAVMISECRSKTLAEKHAAYREIIATYPDMEIPKGNNHNHIKSFHRELEKLITYEEQVLERFLAPEADAFYQARIHYKDHDRCDEDDPFTTHEKALADALDQLCEKEEFALEYPYMGNSEFLSLHITKVFPDHKEKRVSAEVLRSGAITDVDQTGLIARAADDEIYLLDSCYFDVPIPFKRGDLVEVDYGGWMGDVYVLESTCRDDAARNEKNIMRADLMDMTAEVYYECDGSVDAECMHFYPNLRYCRRELAGKKQILKYVSLYMQDKLWLPSLLKIQKHLLLEEDLESL